MAEETQISTPTETVEVDTSSNIEPETVDTETDEDTSIEEPTSGNDVAETETESEPTLYAGKYKTVEELEKGYKESEKAFNEVAELKKQIEAMNQAKAEQEYKAQQEALRQAQARGFNSVEQQEIADQVTLAEFEYYANNIQQVAPECFESVRQNFIDYYNTANRAYLDEAKRYFSSEFIEEVAIKKDHLQTKLTNEATKKANALRDENTRKLAESLKTDFADFLADLDENEGKAEALRAFCSTNSIQSKEDMATFQTIYSKIVEKAKSEAIKEYEAQKAIEATKQASQIETTGYSEVTNSKMPTYAEFMSMSRDEYEKAVEQYGLEAVMNAK